MKLIKPIMAKGLLLLLSGLLVMACGGDKPQPYVGTSVEDFQREGMNPERIELWEDGLRTDMQPGSYEWWYFDAEMENGTKVVVVFYTKSMFAINEEAQPSVSINITPLGQETLKASADYSLEQASYATDKFDVRMGESYGYGDLNTYRIHAEAGDMVVDLTLERSIPSWRPGNGHFYFGEQGEQFFAWLPSVPNGHISGSLHYNGETHQVSGSGYHDHNWGNAAMNDLMRNWYWTRGQVDGYTFIAAELRATADNANSKIPVLMVADQGGVVADASLEGAEFSLVESQVGPHPDPASIEEIAHQVNIHYQRQGTRVDIELDMGDILNSTDLLLTSSLSETEIKLARLLGRTPWYTRSLSGAQLQIDSDEISFDGDGFAVLEKMDFE